MTAIVHHRWRDGAAILLGVLLGLILLLLSCEVSPDLVARRQAEIEHSKQVGVELNEQEPVRDLMTHILKLDQQQRRQLRVLMLQDHALVEDHVGVRYLCRKDEHGWQVVAFGDGVSMPASSVTGVAAR